jgi:hypothetical protein
VIRDVVNRSRVRICRAKHLVEILRRMQSAEPLHVVESLAIQEYRQIARGTAKPLNAQRIAGRRQGRDCPQVR